MDSSVHGTLRRKQRRLARDNPGLLVALAKGANAAIHECQHQFRNQRWNCSTRNFLRGKNLFGKIVDKGWYIILKVCGDFYGTITFKWFIAARIDSLQRTQIFD